MDTVDGALGHLFYVVVEVTEVPVKELVNPGAKAAITRKAQKKPDVTLQDYSQTPIPIFTHVSLEFQNGGRRVRVPV